MTCIGYNGRTYIITVRELANGRKILLLNYVEETQYPQDIRDYARMRAEHAGLI